MTDRDPSVAPLARREPTVSLDCPGSRCVHPIAALAEMIDKVLTASPSTAADAVNEAHRLGEAASSALLDAGDLLAWQLATRVANEITALARVGWVAEELD
jgi:hypothetical protein